MCFENTRLCSNKFDINLFSEIDCGTPPEIPGGYIIGNYWIYLIHSLSQEEI